MPYMVCICEDNAIHALELKWLVDKWGESRKVSLATLYFDAEAFDYQKIVALDIILLDVEMGAIKGYEIAKKIRDRDSIIPIVFISGHESYGLKCHGVMALDYLVKPVSEERLFAVLDHARRISTIRNKETILLANKLFVLNEIIYLEAGDHSTIIHTINGFIDIPLTLTEAVKSLPQDQFGRCHRSFAVHFLYIKQASKDAVITEDNRILPVGRAKAPCFLQQFFHYHRRLM